MSRIFDALQKSEAESKIPATSVQENPVADVLVLAAVPNQALEDARAVTIKPAPIAHLVAATDERSLGAEKFRVLAARLTHARRRSNAKIIQVTSSAKEEGKTLVVANLAISLAKRGKEKILVVEGDLRRPALRQTMGLPAMEGLKQWWAKPEEDAHRFLCRLNGLPLWLMPAGGELDDPTEFLHSPRTHEMIRDLSRAFDWVIIDSPPLLPFADCNLWSAVSDGTLLVVREGQTSKRQMEKAMDTLDNPRLLGVVMNGSQDVDQRGGYSYYGEREARPAPAQESQ